MMVIQGIPVDPRQWLDPSEFQQSILLSLEQARSRVLAR
jgi:hypothetical protein